jgi:hypothetical protein
MKRWTDDEQRRLRRADTVRLESRSPPNTCKLHASHTPSHILPSPRRPLTRDRPVSPTAAILCASTRRPILPTTTFISSRTATTTNTLPTASRRPTTTRPSAGAITNIPTTTESGFWWLPRRRKRESAAQRADASWYGPAADEYAEYALRKVAGGSEPPEHTRKANICGCRRGNTGRCGHVQWRQLPRQPSRYKHDSHRAAGNWMSIYRKAW